jgi:hypothetical protein
VARIGGDAVGSGGNFDSTLTIENGRVLPRGSLDLGEGEEVKKLYVWLAQMQGEDGGAAAAGFQDATGLSSTATTWRARSDVVQDGTFQPGLAVALALAVIQKPAANGVDKATTVRWWSETVKLQ